MRRRRVERLPVFEVSGERERVLLGQVLLEDADTTTSLQQRVRELYTITYDCRMYRWSNKGFKELHGGKKAHAFFTSQNDKLIVTASTLDRAALPSLFAVGPREVELLRVSLTILRVLPLTEADGGAAEAQPADDDASSKKSGNLSDSMSSIESSSSLSDDDNDDDNDEDGGESSTSTSSKRASSDTHAKMYMTRCDATFRGHTFSTSISPGALPEWRFAVNLGFVPPACRDVISFRLVACEPNSPETVLSRSYLGLSDVVEPTFGQHELRLHAEKPPVPTTTQTSAPPLPPPNLPADMSSSRSARCCGVLVVQLAAQFTVLNAPDGGDLPLEQRAVGSGIVGDLNVAADVDLHDPLAPNLMLTNKSLRVVPEGVFRFDRLQVLSLQNNALVSLSARVGMLRSLRVLRLWSNALTSLPDELEQLPHLETLDFGRNHMTEMPPVVARLTGLVELQCHWNLLTKVPAALARLTRLATLNLSINRIAELPASLARLTNLRNLELSHNEFARLPECICDGMAASLEVLLATGNLIKVLPTRFTTLAALNTLDLGSNRLLGLPSSVERLTALRTLSVRNNAMRALPSKLRGLKQLREINCSLNRLTSLGGLPAVGSLERLFCWKNKLDTFPDSISALTNLITLDASDNVITHLPASFGGLTALRMCQLARNRLGSLPDSICELRELVDLGVFDNRLDALPPLMGKMSALQSLRVECNFLKALPDAMSALHQLAVLDVGNNLLQEVPPWIAQLSSIVSLNFFANRVTMTAPLPPRLGSLARLSSLYLSYCNLAQKWADGTVDAIAVSLSVLHIDGNDLYRLPTGLSALLNLSELHIGSNQLLALPPWLGTLTRLMRLHAPFNRISNLLPATRCTNLQELNLSHNNLSSVPSEMAALRALVDLDLSNNDLKTLPSELRALPRLALLKLTGNRILPKSVHGAGGGVAAASATAARQQQAHQQQAQQYQQAPLWVECAFAKPEKKRGLLGALTRSNSSVLEIDSHSAGAVVGWAEMNGRRPSQEDGVLVLPTGCFRGVKDRTKGEPADALFAVFDGHGGPRAAQLCCEQFAELVRVNLERFARFSAEPPPPLESSPPSPAAPLPPLSSSSSPPPSAASPSSPSLTGRSASVSGASSSSSSSSTMHRRRISSQVSSASLARPMSDAIAGVPALLLPNPSVAEVLAASATVIETSEDDGGGGGGAAVVTSPGRAIASPRAHSPKRAISMSTSIRQLLDGTQQWMVLNEPNALVTAPASFDIENCPVDYDQCFVQAFRDVSRAVDGANIQEGAAAVSAYVSGQMCVLACAGDARAVVYDHDGGIRATTFDHKPHSLREMERIRAAGGFVTENGRVNGTLGLSRAVGDSPFQPMVTHTPDIVIVPLQHAPCCLVLACDGVWDVLTRRQVWALIATEKSAARAALLIRDYAHCMGSTDNISVIVVFLNDFADDAARARYTDELLRQERERPQTARSAALSSSTSRRHSHAAATSTRDSGVAGGAAAAAPGRSVHKVRHRVRRTKGDGDAAPEPN
jgi:Leucine-rich repeat (LRR) protein/serine/threonine protein phosphatase PrpC